MSEYIYTFRIDAFTPDTIPMARLAEYMAALADLVGFEQSTHFVRVQKGSANLLHKIDAPDAPKVERRLQVATTPDAPKDVAKAMKTLDDLLAEDNAKGEMISPTGAVIIPFPGRDRPKPLVFPAIRQDGSIDGQVVSVGGRDATAHVILQDGPVTYSHIDLKRDVARELGALLYGPKVRLFGRGRWERSPDGSWKLLSFSVDRFEVLDEAPLAAVLRELRELPGNSLSADANVYDEMMALRLGDDEVH